MRSQKVEQASGKGGRGIGRSGDSNTPESRSRSRSHSSERKGKGPGKNGGKGGGKAGQNENSSKNLNADKFVWGKKIEEMKKQGIDLQKMEVEEKKKEDKFQREIEKVRKRRLEQEKEFDKEKMGRQQGEEEESYQRWLEKEEQFHIEQAKMRSEIRIVQGREQPVDYLVKILLIHRGKFDYDDSQEREMRKPYILLGRLTAEELVQLRNDIKEQLKIELNDYYKQFWDEMEILIEDKLHSFQKQIASSKGRSSVIGDEFEKEVNEMIGDKTYDQLIELEKEINQTLDNPTEFKIDVEYWENVLKKLKVRKAKAFLEEMGAGFLEKNKNHLETKKVLCSVNINSGDLSPRLLDFEKKFEGLLITTDEDIEVLNEERGNILVRELQKVFVNEKEAEQVIVKRKDEERPEWDDQEDEEEETEEVEAKNFIDGKEEQAFDEVVNVSEMRYEWMNKYVPRKPHYFNRVKVGYDWNKYNQTHYDQDNPPPKIVQGYKFNVFYPDLIDPTKAPEFHLEATDNPNFCNIRFHAGPPYEDVAFKIWNREWDFSDKQGFKCIFEHNILHLYFNFRRARYRR